jgi:hypothetical protein
VYVWDATKATVRADSSQVVPVFVKYGCQSPNFTAEVGVGVITDATTPTYTVSSAGKPGGPWDATLYIPDGTGPGLSTDGHFCVVDKVRQRWHDFELFHDQGYANGKLTGWTGGCSMPLGAMQEPKGGGPHGGATVAKFPLRAGLVTTDDVKSGAINHALVFTATNLGPAPNPYPANTSSSYTGPNVSMPQNLWQIMPSPGTWLRLSPNANLNGLSAFERMVAVALQRYGMFCRDRSTDFALHGMDLGGQGQSYATWRSVGVPLSSKGQVAFSAAFRALLPSLQVLDAPPH